MSDARNAWTTGRARRRKTRIAVKSCARIHADRALAIKMAPTVPPPPTIMRAPKNKSGLCLHCASVVAVGVDFCTDECERACLKHFTD